MKLYQREGCPFSAKVRRTLTKLNLSVELINVPKLASRRTELAAVVGEANPSVPVLVDGDTIIRDSAEIVTYLRNLAGPSWFGDPSYGLTRTLSGVAYSDAIGMVKEALAEVGFGVLTEIDVKATLKKKLDADFRPYIILGACNPTYAHKALSGEPAIGLLLPCNVVVSQGDNGDAVVSALDPVKLFGVVNDPAVEPIAKEVRAKLVSMLNAL